MAHGIHSTICYDRQACPYTRFECTVVCLLTNHELETVMPIISERLPDETTDVPTNRSWEIEEIQAALKEADLGDFATYEEVKSIANKWCSNPS